MTDVPSGRSRLRAAYRAQPVDRTPVWFMRQAGQALLDGRDLRGADVLAVQRDPDRAAEIAVRPLERFGVDGAVLYADIMLPAGVLGIDYRLDPAIGPIIDRPVRGDDLARLRSGDVRDELDCVPTSVARIREALGERAGVIGFAGGPFTVAAYLVEGRRSRTYDRARAMIHGRPDAWRRLVEQVTDVTVAYLDA